MFLDQVAIAGVLQPNASDADKERYVTYSGFRGPGGIPTAALAINIQPADAQFTALNDGIVGKTFKGFTLASGVSDGMRLTISGTNDSYIVRGRLPYKFMMQHIELVLFKD